MRIALNKRDLLTIAVLSIIFFSLAVWSLGLTQSPITTWKTTKDETFYVDLGTPSNVGAVYFLVKNGSAYAQLIGKLGFRRQWVVGVKIVGNDIFLKPVLDFYVDRGHLNRLDRFHREYL